VVATSRVREEIHLSLLREAAMGRLEKRRNIKLEVPLEAERMEENGPLFGLAYLTSSH
jgi:hypothetical protein